MKLSHIYRTTSALLSRPALLSKQIHFLATPHRKMSTAMGKRLEGKTVLITGASSGIGKSTAQEFARTSPKNLKLILTARRIDSLKELAAEITKEVGDGVQVLPVQLDVSQPGEVAKLIPNLPKEFQEIDVLVNNAGLVRGVDRVGDIKTEDMDVMFATNVTGLINVTQAVLPQMKKRGESGAGDIINVGSIAGREPYPNGSIYCATKAAVRSFTDAMRKELIATRIRIIEIDPGQVETEFSVVRFYGDKSKADAVYAGCEPLTPDDIAEIVVFTAGRRENVVVADTLVFPNHQVSCSMFRSSCGFLIAFRLMCNEGGGDGHAQEVVNTETRLTCSIGGCNGHAQRACELAKTVDRHDPYNCIRKMCHALELLLDVFHASLDLTETMCCKVTLHSLTFHVVSLTNILTDG
jgi:3-hydroxy acid dehydrogenase/malonic semialdehyde reductase